MAADLFDLDTRNAELAVPLRGRRRGQVERATTALAPRTPATDPATLIPAARAWLAANRPELGTARDLAENLTDAEVMGAIQAHYPNGGWGRFVVDSVLPPLTHAPGVEGTPTWIEAASWDA